MVTDLLVGRSAIAAALKCSEKTVSRLYRAGKLRSVYKKLGGETSPLVARPDALQRDLHRLRRKKGG